MGRWVRLMCLQASVHVGPLAVTGSCVRKCDIMPLRVCGMSIAGWCGCGSAARMSILYAGVQWPARYLGTTRSSRTQVYEQSNQRLVSELHIKSRIVRDPCTSAHLAAACVCRWDAATCCVNVVDHAFVQVGWSKRMHGRSGTSPIGLPDTYLAGVAYVPRSDS